PNYNPELSEQSYFTAGVALSLPIYMGGKIRAAQNVAENRLKSSKLNLEVTKNTIDFLIITQYFKMQYFNSMLHSQRQLLETYKKTKRQALSLVENEIIPPYQEHWANVALSQAETNLKNLELKRETAVLKMQHLLEIDDTIHIDKRLQPVEYR